MPDTDRLDWPSLDRLRGRFLARDAATTGPYWKNHDTLAAYDATYAERIGWKWDTLLRELRLRAWAPSPATTLLDFGCGSGVAGRRVLAEFGANRFAALALADHSPEAVAFAAERARAAFPGLKIQTTPIPPEPYTLVVSHVLNELTAEARAELLALAARAACVIWVEPGTHADSRALAAARDDLRSAGHRIVAPCTHRENCPLFRETNTRDWCHFFAEPPPGVQNDPSWVRFAQRAGVDLRSQAYSCLVLDRVPEPAVPAGSARLLGRPEVFKPYARFLACESDDLHWLELPKRVDPALVKRLDRDPPVPLYRLQHDGKRVSSAEPLECGGLSLECGGLTPLSTARLDSPPPSPPQARQAAPDQSGVKPPHSRDWPHSPIHRLSETGTYMVTAGTLHKTPLLSTPAHLDIVRDHLFAIAEEYGWRLQAWAILSNHYHFIAHSPTEASTLARLVSKLHTLSARALNQLDNTPGRKVWFQYWDTRITFETSLFARLHYVHTNPSHHGVANDPTAYPWCSAAWFARHAEPSFQATLASFKTDQVTVPDDF